MIFDTICAISTAVNDGAIAIIRVSGNEALDIVSQIFSKDLRQCKSHTINYGYILDNQEIIDEVLVSVFLAPKTYTTENIVEINTHGGSYVVRRIMELLISKGARLAEKGEFSKRAYLHGRINLSQAEAINDLIKAKTKVQAKSAINGLKNSVQSIINPLLADVMKIIGIIEVNIDYPEYDDVEIMTQETIKPFLIQFQKRLKQLVDEAQLLKELKDGISVALVGKPNVGKSSLLNALLQEDKAIVTDIAGTTRDLVEGQVQLKNITLNLIDTAGIRESKDVVEKIGIDKSKNAIEKADLIILVLDDTYDKQDEEIYEKIKAYKHIIVHNKKDKQKATHSGINISALNNDIDELLKHINKMYENHQVVIENDVLNSDRQIGLMIKALNEIEESLNMIDNNIELDIVVDNLRFVYQYLNEIIGSYQRDDLLDHLFKNFCLGK